MHIISYKKINDFIKKHNQAESSLSGWYNIVKKSDFNTFVELKNTFPSADIVGNFVIFNIGGNNYRLIAKVLYKARKVYIRHILTHAEYDKGEWRKDTWF